MAEGYAGFSTGAPKSTAQGQGMAQVFAPIQPNRIDTSALQRGIAMNVEDKRLKDASKAKAEAARKIALAEKQKEVGDLKDGEFRVFQETYKEMDDKFFEELKNIDPSEYDEFTSKYMAERGNVAASEARHKEFVDDLYKNPNKKVWSEEDGDYITGFEYSGKYLNRELSDDDRSMIEGGTFGKFMDNEFLETNNTLVNYTDDFNAEREIVSQFQDWAGSSKETQAYLSKYKDGVDMKTIISQMPEEEQQAFRDHIKGQTDLQRKWTVNSTIDQKLPDYVLRDETFKDELDNQWNTFVDEAILPSTVNKTKDFRSDPSYDKDGGDGGDDVIGFNTEAGYSTSVYNPKTKTFTKRKVLGAGNVTIGNITVQGTTFVDGVELVVDENDAIIPDSQDKAASYINSITKSLSDAEKKAYEKSRAEVKNSKPIQTKRNEEFVEKIKKKMEEEGGFFNDTEGNFIDFLVEKGNLDESDEFTKKELDKLREYLEENKNDFTDEKVRVRLADEIVEKFPYLFEGGEIIEDKKEAPKKTEEGGAKNPFEQK